MVTGLLTMFSGEQSSKEAMDLQKSQFPLQVKLPCMTDMEIRKNSDKKRSLH